VPHISCVPFLEYWTAVKYQNSDGGAYIRTVTAVRIVGLSVKLAVCWYSIVWWRGMIEWQYNYTLWTVTLHSCTWEVRFTFRLFYLLGTCLTRGEVDPRADLDFLLPQLHTADWPARRLTWYWETTGVGIEQRKVGFELRNLRQG